MGAAWCHADAGKLCWTETMKATCRAGEKGAAEVAFGAAVPRYFCWQPRFSLLTLQIHGNAGCPSQEYSTPAGDQWDWAGNHCFLSKRLYQQPEQKLGETNQHILSMVLLKCTIPSACLLQSSGNRICPVMLRTAPEGSKYSHLLPGVCSSPCIIQTH